jgi:hypothetical protein
MLLMLAVSIAAIANNKIIVQNTGKVNVYDNLATAMTNAVAGDTLYLSDGSYDAITINKLVYLRGTGKTSIAGSLTIEIAGNPTPTDALIEGLIIEDAINVNKKITNLTIRQCTFKRTFFNAEIPNALIDRCWQQKSDNDMFLLNSYTNTMTVKNTKINYLGGASSLNNGCTFINCNIRNYNFGWHSSSNAHLSQTAGTFKNCIIYYGNSPEELANSTIINCVLEDSYVEIPSSSTSTNVYWVNFSMNEDCEFPKDANQYKGDDGTQVGIYGGTTPFDLTPAVPHVSSAQIEVDQTAKKLMIQLEVEVE